MRVICENLYQISSIRLSLRVIFANHTHSAINNQNFYNNGR
jgi:hypothetical protein